MRIQFGSYWLDDQRFILERDGFRVSIRPKVFDLLAYLVRERDRVVPREELVEALWGGSAVGMGSLSGLVNELRKLLGEGGRGPSSIRTVHARGYQFVAEVDSLEQEPVGGAHDLSSSKICGDSGIRRFPEVLPAPMERALWLYLRENPQAIGKVSVWLEHLEVEATATSAERMEWKPAMEERTNPVHAMRTVGATVPRAKEASRGSERTVRGREPNRSA